MLLMDHGRFARARRPQVAVFCRRPSIAARIRSFAAHRDPLAEASNWVALTTGSHLPFWPLYVLFAVGRQAWPTSVLTAAMAPFFLVVRVLCRQSSLLGRITTPMLGVANTVFTIWYWAYWASTRAPKCSCSPVRPWPPLVFGSLNDG